MLRQAERLLAGQADVLERQPWKVHAEYQVRGGKLYPYGPTVREYVPAETPQVATALARLVDGDDVAVLRFASEWGLLGCRQLQGGHGDEGDPLDWIRAHARGVGVCVELLKRLQMGDTSGIKTYLQERFVQKRLLEIDQKDPEDRIKNNIFGVGAEPPRFQSFRLKAPWDRTARLIAGSIINANLDGLRPALHLDTDDQSLRLGVRGGTLLDTIYWHLASYAVQVDDRKGRDKELAVCEFDGQFFERTDRRERFCPPPEGSRQSLCQRKAEYRARRKRV